MLPVTWYSLVLIYACTGNPMAHPWSPTPDQVVCDKGHWGYTDPILDFQSLSECNTGGRRIIDQQPHFYTTWRCVADEKKMTEDGGSVWSWVKRWF